MAKTIGGIELTLDIHKESDLVTVTSNIAGALTPIIKIEPKANQLVYWPAGNILQLKLFTAAGVEVENGAELSLYKVGPGGRNEELLGTKVYAAWRNIDFGDQFDPERWLNLGIPFHEGDAIAAFVQHGWDLELRLKSSIVVDWARTDVAFHTSVGEDIITT